MKNSVPDMEASVRAFHEKYGHLISDKPNDRVDMIVTQLRLKLIKEEWQEMHDGLMANDLVEIADGAADLIYVVIGTCISYGIPINRIFTEVQRSNMTKTPVKAIEGQKYGTKTPKGPDFIKPDIWGILFKPEVKTELEQKYDSDEVNLNFSDQSEFS